MANILFSALSARRGGGLTYIRNVVREFPCGAGHRLTILSPQPIEGLADHPDVEWAQAPSWTLRPIPRVLFGSIYFRYFWSRRHEVDAVYYAGGSFDIALPPVVKTIVAFRNMLPFDQRARDLYPYGWIRLRHWLLEHAQSAAFRRADLVIFISQHARDVIDQLLSDRKGRSVVIPHGASRTTGPLAPAIAQRLPEKFVLYLSIIDVYKAQVELVEAWAKLRERRNIEGKLVLAGPEYPPYAARLRAMISRLRLEDEVILTGPIAHDQVSDLARRALVNVFMSSCENCPNILLELLLVGRPLLVSSIAPMPEFGGPRLAYADPYDVEEIAAKLARLLDDPAYAADVADAAAERSGQFTWKRSGEMTWTAILCCAEDTLQHTPLEIAEKQPVDVQ